MGKYKIGKDIGKIQNALSKLNSGVNVCKCNQPPIPERSSGGGSRNSRELRPVIDTIGFLHQSGDFQPPTRTGRTTANSYVAPLPAGKSMRLDFSIRGGYEECISCVSNVDSSVISKNNLYDGATSSATILQVLSDRQFTFRGIFKACYVGDRDCDEVGWGDASLYVMQETATFIELAWSIYGDRNRTEFSVNINII